MTNERGAIKVWVECPKCHARIAVLNRQPRRKTLLCNVCLVGLIPNPCFRGAA